MKHHPHWRLVFVVLLAILLACGTPPSATPGGTPAGESGLAVELRVFAAASLTEAFLELGKRFESANPGTTVTFNFAGSDKLAQQINQGAPVDVFAAANRAQMDNVISSGQVISGTERTLVRNRLVVVYPIDNPASLTELKDLAKPGIKLVLANTSVPVGSYSLDFLAKASKLPENTVAFSPTVLQNVVSYEENVRAVLSKVVLGEADAGIVYTSDIARNSADKVGRLDIPDALNTIATYPIATIKDSPHAEVAQKFVEYVLSPEGQRLLGEYGFISGTG